MFKGNSFELRELEHGLVHLVFEMGGESVNKFNIATMDELSKILDMLELNRSVKGLLISSGKSNFAVGADINEFGAVFKEGEQSIKDQLSKNTQSFNRLEDLPFPTVVAVNGYALGGGTEFCLACDYRLAEPEAIFGLPETKLGIIPGWGGTLRLPRIAGVDVAVEWISSGREQPAEKAQSDGVIDGVVAANQLETSAVTVLKRILTGELNYHSRREQKQSPLRLNDMESLLSFESSKAFVAGQAGRNYPAPVAAVQVMQAASKCGRQDALNFERDEFAKLAMGSVAQSLVGLFVGDQMLSKKAKAWERLCEQSVGQAAVVGAGIMGGGIAYQSAYSGVAIIMKDIAAEGIHLGMQEASKLLAKRVERGRVSPVGMAEILTRITPSLSYEGFGACDIVIEAVVESLKLKQAVLSEVEQHVSADTVLCTNTSTISVDDLAQTLERPENFCGMHFFNPVHAMPLVEVIRGKYSSDQAIARAVSYACELGKKVVVVNDCPGFLVNRVLFPYFAGFVQLLRDGADFQQVDTVMERWGWPMGPAYLMDVVGIDTGLYAEAVMAKSYPDRMARAFKPAFEILYEEGRYGQKTGHGFYVYENDKSGKSLKRPADETYSLLKPHCADLRVFEDEEIVARMLVPMAIELLRCLEEGVVESASDADMALVYGLGFPPFRGGIFRWLDTMGLKVFAELASQYAHLSPLYSLTSKMQVLVEQNHSFYSSAEN